MDQIKRYQVFVSSTFADLEVERGRVMQTILNYDCIPAGMELFPAMDEEQYEYIKRIIDDSDYYLLIIGGCYGSVDESGMSWTEKEYYYAVSRGIPVIAFIHEDYSKLPARKTDQDDKKLRKLNAFKRKVATGRLIRKWTNADDLELAVANSLAKVIKHHPRIGWVRADKVISGDSSKVIDRLTKEISTHLDEIKRLNTKVSVLEADLAEKEEAYQVLESSYRVLQDKNVRIQEEVERLRANQENNQNLEIKAKEEIYKLQEEVERLRVNQNLEPSYDNAKKKIILLEKENSDLRAQQKINQDFEKAYQDAQQKIVQLEKEAGELKQINSDLKQNKEDALKENQRLHDEIGNLSEEKKQLQEEIVKLSVAQAQNNTVLTEGGVLKILSEAIKEAIDSYLQKNAEVIENEPIPSNEIPIDQQSTEPKNRVFICHRLNREELKNNDETVATALKKALIDKGYDCSIILKDFNVKKVGKAINDCDVFILVLSATSYNHKDAKLIKQPDNVLRALALAQHKRKAICVFQIDKTQLDETLMSFLEPYLEEKTIDASGDYQHKISDLIDLVDKIFNTLKNK